MISKRVWTAIGIGVLIPLVAVGLYFTGKIPEHSMLLLANISLYTFGIFCLGFIIGYPLLGPGWRKTAVGFAVWFFVFSVFFIVVSVSLTLILGPDYYGRPAVRLLTYIMPSFAIINLVRVMVMLQVRGYRERYEDSHRHKLI